MEGRHTDGEAEADSYLVMVRASDYIGDLSSANVNLNHYMTFVCVALRCGFACDFDFDFCSGSGFESQTLAVA